MDIKTNRYDIIDSTLPETSLFSKEIQKEMRKNIKSTTKRMNAGYGPILHPFILAYLDYDATTIRF